MAYKDNIDWILHIDTDELMYPGGAGEYSLARALSEIPADVDTLIFPNYESMPERDDVSDPFSEVSTPSLSAPPHLQRLDYRTLDMGEQRCC